jgi:hypothetical protein
MDEPGVRTDAVGVGFPGGFCAGLCAPAGDSGAKASNAAKKKASTDRGTRGARRFSFAHEVKRFVLTRRKRDFAVSQRVVMTILFLEILSQRDVFIST